MKREQPDLIALWADMATAHPLAVWCRWWLHYWG